MRKRKGRRDRLRRDEQNTSVVVCDNDIPHAEIRHVMMTTTYIFQVLVMTSI